MPSPTPENLAAELPSGWPAPAACSELPELPLPQPAGVSEALFPGFVSLYIETSGAMIRVLTKGAGRHCC